MPNGYFLIKQRETGAGGPPASLSAGQFAFNKVDSTLYLGTSAEIVAVGGTGTFATTTSLSNYLLLSGGHLTGLLSGTEASFNSLTANDLRSNTATLGTSSTLVATTAFVQNSISSSLSSVPTSERTIALVKSVTNAEADTLTRGEVVYSFGAIGNRVSVKRAYNSSDITSSKTLGLVMDTIAAGGTGYIMLAGSMTQLNLGSYVAGDTLWLGSTPGTFTKTKAVPPQHLVYIGVVERANNGDGTAYIKIQNGYELNEIHDVLINGTVANQVIRRNSTNTLWTNQTLPTESWDSVYSSVNATSGSWNTAYTNLVSNSAAYLSGFDLSLIATTSATWDSVYSTVNANSAEKWNYQGTDLKDLSGSWQQAYTNLTSNSAAYLSAADPSKLINGELEVVLASTGQVNLPKANNSESNNSRIQSVSSIDILADQQLWTFGKDGKVSFPDGTKQTTAYDTVSSSEVKTKVNTLDADLTFISSHTGSIFRITTTSIPITIAIPESVGNDDFEVGTQTAFINIGTHSVSFSAAPNVTLYSSDNKFVLSGVGDTASLIHTGMNEWVLCGKLTT